MNGFVPQTLWWMSFPISTVAWSEVKWSCYVESLELMNRLICLTSLMQLMKLQFIYSFFFISICVLLFSLNEMWYFENRLWIKNFFILLISYLVGAVGLQSLWSLSLALTDVYALMVRRRFRNTGVVSLFAIGDGVRNLLTGKRTYQLISSTFLKNSVLYLFALNDFNQWLINHECYLDSLPLAVRAAAVHT